MAANKKLPGKRNVPRKNKNDSEKPKVETVDDDDDNDDNDDDDKNDVSNESISGSRPKTFEGNCRIFNFLLAFSAPQVKMRARCRAANRKVFLPFLSFSPEIAALYEVASVQIRFCLSLFDFFVWSQSKSAERNKS